MGRFMIYYVIGLITFLIVDFIWIKFFIGPIFFNELDNILLEKPRLAPAFLFYCLFIFGLILLVVYPGFDSNLSDLLPRAMLFGLVCYGTYELTNYATIKGWSLKLVFMDLAWGAFISGFVATILHQLSNRFL